MRTGYAIRDKHQHGWLQTRTRVEGVSCPVAVWSDRESQAMQFWNLKDARAMLTVAGNEDNDDKEAMEDDHND